MIDDLITGVYSAIGFVYSCLTWKISWIRTVGITFIKLYFSLLKTVYASAN